MTARKPSGGGLYTGPWVAAEVCARVPRATARRAAQDRRHGPHLRTGAAHGAAQATPDRGDGRRRVHRGARQPGPRRLRARRLRARRGRGCCSCRPPAGTTRATSSSSTPPSAAGHCDPSHLALFNRRSTTPGRCCWRRTSIYVGGGNTVNLLAVWRAQGIDRDPARGVGARRGARGPVRRLDVLVRGWRHGRVRHAAWCRSSDGLGLLPGSNCPHYRLRRDAYAAAARRRAGAGARRRRRRGAALRRPPAGGGRRLPRGPPRVPRRRRRASAWSRRPCARSCWIGACGYARRRALRAGAEVRPALAAAR